MNKLHSEDVLSGKGSITSPISDYLHELLEQFSGLDAGEVADYIPELAKADHNLFGICIATTEGHVYEAGDSRHEFTIQSISKPFVYGLALEDNGRTDMRGKIGVEPTGDAFNSISLDPVTGQPANPMINAGAIASAGQVMGHDFGKKMNRLMDMMSAYAGRPLTVDESVYQSESETGYRNRAIGYMLRNFNILEEDPTETLELYFKQCSVLVCCRDLAIMGATLANVGTNPLTKERAIRGEYVENVLSVMGSCGMYDYAGEWVYKAGMPAKSGVAGGIVAVLPERLGIGVFSPPLDQRGNSVRGIEVCNRISMDFNLHMFNVVHPGKNRRLATLSQGLVFGEMAWIERSECSAAVTVDVDALCYKLDIDDFDAMMVDHSTIKVKVLGNLLRLFSRNLRKANTEIGVLC